MEKTILIVEDHASLRQALAFVFEREPGFERVLEAGTLAEARGLLEGVHVAVLDLFLPDGNGMDLIGALREANPQCENDPECVVLVLTASLDPEWIARSVEAGAAGVFHKSAPIHEITDAVRRLLAGETLLSREKVLEIERAAAPRREHAGINQAKMGKLTPRERQILQALADGLDSKEIAERLGIAVETERTHLVNLLSKLGVHSRLQALLVAIRHGLVEFNSPPGSSPESDGISRRKNEAARSL